MTTRLGAYELLRELSRGGMGEVWLAKRHGSHGFERIVALKTIRQDLRNQIARARCSWTRRASSASCGPRLTALDPQPRLIADQLVALCAYCQSENLLAVNLVPSARRGDAQAARLGDLLVERMARRRRLRAASVLSLFALVASAWGLYVRLVA